MGHQWSTFLRKGILQLLVISMTICSLTPANSVYAVEEQTSQQETEVIVLAEDESLRDESSKTFILSDKTMQKVIYSVPVHYQDNGQWKEIDNTMVDDGLISEEETSTIIDEVSELEESISPITNELIIEETETNGESDLEETNVQENNEQPISNDNEIENDSINETGAESGEEINSLGQIEEFVSKILMLNKKK